MWPVGRLVGLWTLAFSPLLADESPRLDPELPYQAQRANAVTYDVDLRVIVTPPAKTRRLQVWLPLPASDYGQEVSGRELETLPQQVEPRIAAEPLFGNTFAYFEFSDPVGAQQIRHRFQVKIWELRWNSRPRKSLPSTRGLPVSIAIAAAKVRPSW